MRHWLVRLCALSTTSLLVLGCHSRLADPNPQAKLAVQAYWEALERSDWKAAYERLHPEIAARLSLVDYEKLQSQLRRSPAFPQGMQIVSHERRGDDVIVTYTFGFASSAAAGPKTDGALRQVIVRKAEESWRLYLTRDFLDSR